MGDNIYMIVGLYTVIGAHIAHETVSGKDIDWQITVPVSLSLAAAGAVAPLANITDPSIGGSRHGRDSMHSSFVNPGEEICGFEYRKSRTVRHKWLSSNIDTSQH